MQFFWKHLHNNKGDENVSKLIWIVIAFVIGALLLSTMSVAFKTDGTGTISGWLNSSLENWFGEADGRDGSVSGGTGGSGLPGGGNPDEGEGSGNDELAINKAVMKHDNSSNPKMLTTNPEKGGGGGTYSDMFKMPADPTSINNVIYEVLSYASQESDGSVNHTTLFNQNTSNIYSQEELKGLANLDSTISEAFAENTFILYINAGINIYIGVDKQGNLICPLDDDPSYGNYVVVNISKAEERVEGDDEIPEGGTLYIGVANFDISSGNYEEEIQGGNGNKFPSEFKDGDMYVFEDYIYAYGPLSMMIDMNELYNASVPDKGWVVLSTTDSSKEEYGAVLSQIGNSPVIAMFTVFESNNNFKSIAKIPDTIYIMHSTFSYCTSMEKTPQLPNTLVYARRAFQNCSNIETVTNLPSSLVNMEDMFYECGKLYSVPNLPEGVKNLESTFGRCKALENAPAIPYGTENMHSTFSGCTKLKTEMVIPETVTNLRDTFSDCTELTTVTLNNVSGEIRLTFNNCPNLKTVNGTISGNLEQTFRNCASLTNAPAILNNNTTMSGTFEGCSSLSDIPTLPEGIYSMVSTFKNCTSLKVAPRIPSTVTILNGTFEGCTKLENAPTLPLYVNNISSIFKGCTNLKDMPSIPDSVQYMRSAFENCSSLTQINSIGSGVIDMNSAFAGCSSLTGSMKILSSQVNDFVNTFIGINNPLIVQVPVGSTTYTSLDMFSFSNVTIQTF